MGKLDELLLKLRECTNNNEENLTCLSKLETIRLVDYLDKLEDENTILRTFADRNIQINVNK